MGDVVAAVDHYRDIPTTVRDALKRRMSRRQYDDIVSIERDAIKGRFAYASELREMHFANGQICNTVTRKRWSNQTVERGLVYCESGHCIVVPTVCRNVSRITRLGDRKVAGAQAEEPAPALAAPAPLLPADPAPGPLPVVPPAAAAPAAGPAESPSFQQVAEAKPELRVPGAAAPEAAPRPPVEGAVREPALPTEGVSRSRPGDVAVPLVSPLPFGQPATPVPNSTDPIAAIPEPGNWLLLLAGLAVVGYVAGRRRND